MFIEILIQSWTALRRNPTRTLLTMLGIVWGIAAVTLLMAYGASFRGVLLRSFEAFGKSAIIASAGQTSEQAGGERAGRRIRFEQADVDAIKRDASLVKYSCLESIKNFPISYGERMVSNNVRAVCPEYGEMRNEIADDGRWISHEDMRERRRVAFLGDKLARKLFAGRPAVGETILINGLRFLVIGTMELKAQMSNYFGSDDEAAFIPYPSAADLWDVQYAQFIVSSSVNAQFEAEAIQQIRETLAKRQRFSPTDKRAVNAWGRQEFRPIIDGITIGLQVLLTFIGSLTLGIGGIGVMNIMLVSVEERIREIGLRRAIGARRGHIRLQFLAEALAITIAGGLCGIALSYALSAAIGPLPLMGDAFDDDSGRSDIHLVVSLSTVAISAAILVFVGLLSGWLPAMRAAKLDPSAALRYE